MPISSRAVQQCSKRRRGPGRLVYKSTRLLQQSLVYKSRQSLPFVCRSTLLHPTTAQEGLKKSPRHRRAPTTTTTSDPKTLQRVAQHGIQRLMIRGLGKPSRWSCQQRTPHPNVISQLCLISQLSTQFQSKEELRKDNHAQDITYQVLIHCRH